MIKYGILLVLVLETLVFVIWDFPQGTQVAIAAKCAAPVPGAQLHWRLYSSVIRVDNHLRDGGRGDL
jgi:hypothetical protein